MYNISWGGFMGVEEEILEEFFKKLENDDKFPVETLNELKNMSESGKFANNDNILNAIKKGVPDEY